MIRLLFSVCFVLVLFLSCQPGPPKQETLKIIFDTDFGPDYDDVGALAFLHAMADSGKVKILATVLSNRYELCAPGMDAMNTYYGRPDLPMGAPKNSGVSLADWQHWLDTLAAKYPHDIQSTSELPDAVTVYRRVLSDQPDTSVTIVTVGFLTNMASLVQSGPDSISPLTGRELVAKKVKKLVSMAGGFPAGREYNVYIDSAASSVTFKNWPTPVIFSGWEIGQEIRTGLRLIASDLKDHPAKDVFRICIPMAKGDSLGRMSWDETAVLIGVYGTKGFFSTVSGKIVVHPHGRNEWVNDPNGKHQYVVQEMPVPDMSRFIEDRMMHESVMSDE